MSYGNDTLDRKNVLTINVLCLLALLAFFTLIGVLGATISDANNKKDTKIRLACIEQHGLYANSTCIFR